MSSYYFRGGRVVAERCAYTAILEASSANMGKSCTIKHTVSPAREHPGLRAIEASAPVRNGSAKPRRYTPISGRP